MIILHAGFVEETVMLWGETPSDSEVAPKRRGRKPKVPRPELYPYDPGLQKLFDVFSETGLSNLINLGDFANAIVWAPSLRGKPTASSPLIAEPFPTNENPTFLPWEVSTFRVPVSNAIEIFCHCANKKMLSPGVIVGNDLAYWVSAMRFAGYLVLHQQFVPDIVKRQDIFRACWKPVFIGEDQNRLERLEKCMPGICRALNVSPDTSPPDTPARVVLAEFIESVVDHLVRTSKRISEDRISPKPRRKKKQSFLSIHDQWLYALNSSNGLMEGNPADLHQLANQIKEWQRPIQINSAAPFRLCFRLEEQVPFGTDTSNAVDSKKSIDTNLTEWNVNYFLQAKDDPSLLISAGDAFNKRKRSVQNTFRRYNFNPGEYLLFSLGQASSICSRVEASLRSSIPVGYRTDQKGAYQFLTEKAGALQQAGFTVMLPAWWTSIGGKQQLLARAKVNSPKMQAGSGLSLDTIVSLNWEIAIGDEKLTMKELRQLAKLKAPLVKFRGEWILIDSGDIQSAIDTWNRKTNEMSMRDLVRMSIGATETPNGLVLGNLEATGLVKDFLSELQGNAIPENLLTPDGFQGQLRPYQSRGYT